MIGCNHTSLEWIRAVRHIYGIICHMQGLYNTYFLLRIFPLLGDDNFDEYKTNILFEHIHINVVSVSIPPPFFPQEWYNPRHRNQEGGGFYFNILVFCQIQLPSSSEMLCIVHAKYVFLGLSFP